MITLTTGQLAAWLGQLFWPFVRIGACFMVAPAFATAGVPARIRVVLAGGIALLVAPLVTVPAGIEPLSAQGVIVTTQQIVIGAALGFSLQIIFDAVTLGGQLLANGMGLSFAYNLDPVHGTETPVVGTLYSI
ncbi:MAG: flagellar biosynthetic protein FliR, partial [Steroidobacteraceae bacterium]